MMTSECHNCVCIWYTVCAVYVSCVRVLCAHAYGTHLLDGMIHGFSKLH